MCHLSEDQIKKNMTAKTEIIRQLEAENVELWWALEAIVAQRAGATTAAIEILSKRGRHYMGAPIEPCPLAAVAS